MKTEEEVIAGMLTLFRGGDGWTTHALTRGADGNKVPLGDSSARAFCLNGAVYTLLEALEGVNYTLPAVGERVLCRLCRAAGLPEAKEDSLLTNLRELAEWNNSRESYGEIQAMLRAALEDGK